MDKTALLKRVSSALKEMTEETKQEEQDAQDERLLRIIAAVGVTITDKIAEWTPTPNITVPDIKIPEIRIPDIVIPEIKVPDIHIPEIKLPDIHIPPITVPEAHVTVTLPEMPQPKVTVNVPEIKVPKIDLSTLKFPEVMRALLEGIDRKNPLPVQMVDPKGNPFYEFGGGGSHGPTVLSDVAYQGRTLIDNTTPGQPALRISGSISAAAASSVSLVNSDGTYYNGDNPLPVALSGTSVQQVSQVSGVAWSTSASIVAITDIFSTTAASTVVNPDNRVRVELPAGASGLTDTELRATSLTVQQLSGSVDSVVVNSGTITTVTGITNSLQAALIDSSGVQYSGSNPLPTTGNIGTVTTVTGVTNSLQAALIDSSGVQYSGSNPLPTSAIQSGTWNIGTLTTLTGITNTVATANIDSGGVQYSGSNPMPTYLVLGAGNSTISVGPTAHDAVDDGAAPQKVGGTAMTTNPTKVADGDIVRFVGDTIGRQIVTPVQIRGLMQTAYVSIATGTEATLLAGVSGVFMDLVSISASTNSTFAITAVVPPYIDVRDCRTGGILFSFPVSGLSATNTGSQTVFSKDFLVPLPQAEAGNAWTVDMNDITGTTVNIQALFARNT